MFGPTLGPIDAPVVPELAKRGLVDGKNVEILFGYANGSQERVNALARDLVSAKPDVLFGLGSEVIKSMFDLTREIPIIGGISENPVRAGFAGSLARPDRNFTGVSFLTDEMAAKRIELLKEVFPAAKRVGMVWNPQHLDDEPRFARQASESLQIDLISFEAEDAPGIDRALDRVAAGNIDSVFVIPSRLTSMSAAKLGKFALEHKLPMVTAWREFSEADCLISYGPNRRSEAQTLANYISRAIQGVAPADLPIQLPSKFEMIVNMRTAKAIGLTIPPSTLLRADELIE